MTPPILDVRGLSVVFRAAKGPVRAVDGVDVAVSAGEVMGLVGESGSGKSVTLRAVLRLLHENADVTGQVIWRGEDLLTVPAERLRAVRGREIGMVFQEPMSALNPVLTIGRQIDEVLVAHARPGARMGRAARRARAAELLDLVGIASAPARLDQYPHEFSGGMRQRAMIAIALTAEPALLLADEPTTALDVTIQDQILKLLLRLVRELDMALLLVTHDFGVVAETCDRVAVMYAGRICEVGGAADVFRRPRHAYTAALLASMPGDGPARQMLEPIPGQPPRLDAAIPGCAFAPRCAFVEPRCRGERPTLEILAPAHASACYASARLGERAT